MIEIYAQQNLCYYRIVVNCIAFFILSSGRRRGPINGPESDSATVSSAQDGVSDYGCATNLVV